MNDDVMQDEIVQDVDTDSQMREATTYLLQQIDQLQQLNGEWTLDGIDVYAMSPVTSSSGLKGLLIDVIGPYDTIITQYTYRANTSSNLSYVNDISPDFPWMISAALFIVLIFCVFRTLGGLLFWRK